MKYKPDWDDAAERFTALWEGKRLDRPCLTLTAPSGADASHPEAPDDPERRWLDPEWVIPNLEAGLANTWWGGESIPSYLLMGGWTVSLGGRPRFSHKTIWFDTFPVDFDQPSPFTLASDNEWVVKHERLYRAVADYAGQDDFQLGKPCLLPANDLLSMHIGTTWTAGTRSSTSIGSCHFRTCGLCSMYPHRRSRPTDRVIWSSIGRSRTPERLCTCRWGSTT